MSIVSTTGHKRQQYQQHTKKIAMTTTMIRKKYNNPNRILFVMYFIYIIIISILSYSTSSSSVVVVPVDGTISSSNIPTTPYHPRLISIPTANAECTNADTTNNDNNNPHCMNKSNKSNKNDNQLSVGEMIEETGFYQSIRLIDEEPLLIKQSKYQLIEVRRSQYYGKVLILDGVVQLTERDSDSYNEMLSHVAMFSHNNPKRVLIIGGGDGYVLHEVLKHTSVIHIDHVDLDLDVINVCKEFFPWSTDAWNNSKVTIHIADGSKFVSHYNQKRIDSLTNSSINFEPYDVIIQDSSDPWTWDGSLVPSLSTTTTTTTTASKTSSKPPASLLASQSDGQRVLLPSSVLYSKEHIQNIYNILSKDGVFIMQAEAIQIPSDLQGIYEWRQISLNVGFTSSRYGSITISSYPTGQIGFLLNEKVTNVQKNRPTIDSIIQRYNTDIHSIPTSRTSYYHPPLQTNTFVLPKWAHDYIYNTDTISF